MNKKIPSKFEIIASILLVVVVMSSYIIMSNNDYKQLIEVVTIATTATVISTALLLNLYILAHAIQGYEVIQRCELKGWTFLYTGFLLLQIVLFNIFLNYMIAKGTVDVEQLLNFHPTATVVYLVLLTPLNVVTYTEVSTDGNPVEFFVDFLVRRGWLQMKP